MTPESRTSLLVFALAIASIVIPVWPSSITPVAVAAPPSSPTRSREPFEATQESGCERLLLQPLLDFYRIHAAPTAVQEPAEQASKSASSGQSPEREHRLPNEVRGAIALDGHDAPRFVIATVPDPTDAHVGHYFDRSVEAIERGLQSRHYLPDRSWLPWPDARATAKRGVREPKCWTEVPGIMLFRPASSPIGSDSAPPPIIMLLVSETPTLGIHKASLQKALDLAAVELSEQVPDVVEILGPTFSASAASLRNALHHWHHMRRGSPRPIHGFHVVSGSVLGSEARSLLDSRRADPPIAFETLDVTEDVLHCAFYEFLREELSDVPRDDLDGVALLSEAENDEHAQAPLPRGPACPQPALRISFPPHIGSLRSAYDILESRPRDSGHSQHGGGPVTHLTPALVDQAGREGRAPDFAPETTVVHEQILDGLVREIAHRDIRYLGVIATDVRDVVFLAKRIHRIAPDVRLFTFGSDIEYLHPDNTDAFRGSLIASTHPFFGIRAHDAPSEPVQMFASDAVEGAYDATRRLLDGGIVRRDALAENTAVWIGVVGNETMVPMAVRWYDHADPNADRQKLLDRAEALIAPRLWRAVVVAALVFSVYHGVRFCRLYPTPVPGRRPRVTKSWLRVFRKSTFFPGPQAVYLIVCMTSLMAFCVYVLSLDMAPLYLDRGRPWWRWIELAAGLSCVLLLLSCWFTAFRRAWSGIVASARAKGFAGIMESEVLVLAIALAMTAFLLLASLCSLVHSCAHAAQPNLVLYVHRSIHLTTNVSLVVPLFAGCAAAYLWSLTNLTRLQLLDASVVKPRDDDTGDSRTVRTPIAEVLAITGRAQRESDRHIFVLERRLTSAIATPVSTDVSYGLSMLVIVWAPLIVFLVIQPLRSLEGRFGATALVCMFVVCGATTAGTLVRLVIFWNALRSLLRHLTTHPIAPAFGRPATSQKTSIGQQISGSEHALLSLSGPLAMLRALHASLDPVADSVATAARAGDPAARALEGRLRRVRERWIDEGAAQAIDETYARELEMLSMGTRPDLETLDRLVEEARCVSNALDPLWRLRSESDTLAKLAPETKDPAIEGTCAYAGALPSHTVAWIHVAEDLVATTIAFFVLRTLRHVRHFMTMLIGGVLLLIVFVSTYAFQPRGVLLTFLWIALGINVGTGFYVFVQLDRDELLSRVVGTTPGQVTVSRDFVLKVVTWVVLPLLSAFALQYPEICTFLFSWTDPLVKTLR